MTACGSKHVAPERVSLFSRSLNDVAPAFPEVVAALRDLAEPCILDGEVVAQRDGRVLPFRYLQARLQRKVVAAALLDEVPAHFIVFDLLARGDDVLVDHALVDRRGQLAEACAKIREPVALAPWSALQKRKHAGKRSRAVRGRARRRQRRAYF
jgi:ATP-dependent DNA ligase